MTDEEPPSPLSLYGTEKWTGSGPFSLKYRQAVLQLGFLAKFIAQYHTQYHTRARSRLGACRMFDTSLPLPRHVRDAWCMVL
jgi:hypothetical protein